MNVMQLGLRSCRGVLIGLIIATAALLSPNMGHAEQDLPVLGDPTAGLLSADQEYRLGRAWLRRLRSQTSILTDPVIQEYAEHLVYRLAAHSDLDAPDLTVVLINNRAINAFAVPGGVIGLNAGLFLSAESEDEVAGVVAHEIAHISQRHFARRYIESQKVNTAMLAAVMASLAVAIAGHGDAGMAGIAASQAGAIQSQLAYSRQNEREADRVGMQTLIAAGMDPHAMPLFFERMHRSRQFSGTPPDFLLTHPVTDERIADSRSRARNLPRPAQRDTLYFDLVRARLIAQYLRSGDEAVRHFEGDQHGKSDRVARYGLAMSHIRLEQFDAAEKQIAALNDEYPDHLLFMLAQAELAFARGDYPGAIERSERLQRISPGNLSNTVLLSRALMRNEQPEEAIRLLRPLVRQRSDDPQLWETLARAYGDTGNDARALHASAEAAFLRGDNRRSLQQMTFAIRESGDDFALRSQLRARENALRQLSEERF